MSSRMIHNDRLFVNLREEFRRNHDDRIFSYDYVSSGLDTPKSRPTIEVHVHRYFLKSSVHNFLSENSIEYSLHKVDCSLIKDTRLFTIEVVLYFEIVIPNDEARTQFALMYF